MLDQEIPPVEDFAKKESKYVKYVRIKSDLLSKFWGTDMYLGAWVLLPEGFDAHPDARYPLAINHGHFPSSVDNWRETPPDPNLKPDYSRAILARRLQSHPGGVRLPVLQGLDRAGFPARAAARRSSTRRRTTTTRTP